MLRCSIKELFRNARRAIYERLEEAKIDGGDFQKGIIKVDLRMASRRYHKKILVLTVSDDGIAAANDGEKQLLFTAFGEASPFKPGQTLNMEHTHLGLSFVKEVVDKHNGKLTLEIENMTKFVLEIPLK